MNRVCLLVLLLLVSCYGRMHHRGRHHSKISGHHEFFYDDPPPAKFKGHAPKIGPYTDDLFGGVFRSQQTASEKENPVVIEEAFPHIANIARNFYGGPSVDNHGEYGAKLGSFNLDHEDRDLDHEHSDYNMEPFDISIPKMAASHQFTPSQFGDVEVMFPPTNIYREEPAIEAFMRNRYKDVTAQHSDMHINHFDDTQPLQDMAASQRGYSNHYSPSHVGGYPDHGVVISDNVAKKIGLYDKDYLKKLGLDSKDEVGAKEAGPEGSGGEVDLDSLPKEDASKGKKNHKNHNMKKHTSISKQSGIVNAFIAPLTKDTADAVSILSDVLPATHDSMVIPSRKKTTIDTIRKAMQKFAELQGHDQLRDSGRNSLKAIGFEDDQQDEIESTQARKRSSEGAKREKERMDKIGVEDYRNGKHADDKKQVAHMKEVFKNSESSGINYNQNGVMVDKKLAEKLGLYDKDYLKKLGVWEGEAKGESKIKAKSKSKKAKTRSHQSVSSVLSSKSNKEERGEAKAAAVKESEETAEFSGDSSSGSGAGTDAKESPDTIKDGKDSDNASAEESKKTDKAEENASKSADGVSGVDLKKHVKSRKQKHFTVTGRKRDTVPGAHFHHGHHNKHSKTHKEITGDKRQLMSFMHPSNDYGVGSIRGNGMMMPQQMQSQLNPNVMNQNAGFSSAENGMSMNGGSPDSRSDMRNNDLGNVVSDGSHTASDGAIHITAATNGIADALARKGSDGDLSDILSKANGAGAADLASFQRGDENVEKGGFIEKAGFRGNPNEESTDENSRNFNDVYLDGNPTEMSKFEKSGSWKVDKTGEPLKASAMTRIIDEGGPKTSYKPDSVSDMVEKMLPMDKGRSVAGGSMSVEEGNGVPVPLGKGESMAVGQNQGEINEIQGEAGNVLKGVSPSDSEMINQILKNGDSTVDTSEGRGELKKLLTGSQQLEGKAEIIEDVPKSASIQSSFRNQDMKVDMLGTPAPDKTSRNVGGYGNENAYSRDIGAAYEQPQNRGPMPLAQMIPRTLPVLDSMGMIPRRFMQSQMKTPFVAEQQQMKGIADSSDEEVLRSVARKPQMEGVPMQAVQNFVGSQGRRVVGGMNLMSGNTPLAVGVPVEAGFNDVGRFNGETTTIEGGVNKDREHSRRDKLPKHEVEEVKVKEQGDHNRQDKLPKHDKENKKHSRHGKLAKQHAVKGEAKHDAVKGDKRQYLAEPDMGERSERMHMSNMNMNNMNNMNAPRIEAVPLHSSGMEGNMLCKKHHHNKPGCKRDEMGDASINGDIQSALDGMAPGHGVNSFNGMSGGVAMMQQSTMNEGGMNSFDTAGGMNNAPGSLEGFSNMAGGSMSNSIEAMGNVPGKPMMASFHPDGEGMGGDTTGLGTGGGMNVNEEGNMEQHNLIGGGNNHLIPNNDRAIDQAMAEEDKIAADSTARNAGKLLRKTDEEDLLEGKSGSLLKNTMDENGGMNFKGHNNSSGSNFEGDDEGEGGEAYDEDDEGEDKMHIPKGMPSSKVEAGETRESDDTDTDLNQEIGDQVVKNDGHMMGHAGNNVVHGTPCIDCHTAGAIGHGAVISGSEAKKIGLNDEAYLKRLGIKECKIKGPGFSEGNHGGAISDEWAKKLDGFDKKYLQQLGIPEEALEGNTATRDCKFVERIAEVLQAKEEAKEEGRKEGKEAKAEISNSAPEAVKNKESVKEITVEKLKAKLKHAKAKIEEKKVTEEASTETKSDEEEKAPETDEKPTSKAEKEEKRTEEKGTDSKDSSAAPEESSKKSEEIKSEKEDATEGSGNTEETTDVKSEKSHTNSTGVSSKADAKKEDTDDIYGESDASLDELNTKEDTLKRLAEEKSIMCRETKVKNGEKVHENCTGRSTNSTKGGVDNSTEESSTVSELNNTLAKLKKLEADTDDGDNTNSTAKEISEILPMDNDVSKSVSEPGKANETVKLEKTDFLKRTVNHKRKRLDELRKRLQGLNPSVLRWRSRLKEYPKFYERIRSEKRYFLKERLRHAKRKRLEILRKKLLTLKKNALFLRSKIISDSKELHKKVQEHLARSSLARHRFKAGQRRLAAKRRRRLHQLRNSGFNDGDNGED